MNKLFYNYLTALLFFVVLFSACSDDDKNEAWKELPTTPITIDGTNVIVTVNNTESATGSVTFKASSEQSATLTLTDVVSGYPSLTMDVIMAPETGGYTFSGSTTVNTTPQTKAVSADPALLTVDANGTISIDGKLSVTLTAYGPGLNLGTYKNNTLALTYSDATLLDKTVYYTISGSTPILILEGIVPGEPTVSIEGVYTDQNGTFEGSTTTQKGTTVTYNGQIETANGMTLALSVKLQESLGMLTLVNEVAHSDEVDRKKLTRKRTEEHAYFLNTSSEKISEAETLIGYLGSLLEIVLRDVTFREDGNVTASYSSLPEDFNIKGWLDGSYTYQPQNWLQSPINLANWYRDGENLYIIPNLEMILKQIKQDAVTGKTRAEGTTDLTVLLQQWFTTGIRMTFKENPYKEEYEVGKEGRYTVFNKLVADYLVYLDQNDIKPLIPLLETVINLYLTDDIITQIKEQSGGLISDPEAMITELLNEMAKAETLEIGLCFNKN